MQPSPYGSSGCKRISFGRIPPEAGAGRAEKVVAGFALALVIAGFATGLVARPHDQLTHFKQLTSEAPTAPHLQIRGDAQERLSKPGVDHDRTVPRNADFVPAGTSGDAKGGGSGRSEMYG